MKLSLNENLSNHQSYSCISCGHGCRSFMVPVTIDEQRSIMALEDWFTSLNVDELFIDLSQPGFQDGALAKREDKSCVFLGDDNLCLIHKKYGLNAKPKACQLFPFVLTPFNNEFRLSLRFDCTGVCQSTSGDLRSNLKDINRLANQIYPSQSNNYSVQKTTPFIHGKISISADKIDTINNAILDKIIEFKLPVKDIVIWLAVISNHLQKVKWANVSDSDFSGLLSLLIDGTYSEVTNSNYEATPLNTKARALFGQILYILCQGPEVITCSKTSMVSKIRKRLKAASEIKVFGNDKGPVPQLWENWNNLDFSDFECSFGNLSDETNALLYRYLINRIAGINYCGLSFYNYSLTEGLQSLALSISAIGWLARVNAKLEKRNSYIHDDFIKAVMVVDSNNGYGTALNAGSARLRLRYLQNHCINIINRYID